METLILTISIPEHFHAEDELSNMLQDDAIFQDLAYAVGNAARDKVVDLVESIEWNDVEVRVQAATGVFVRAR